VRAAAASQKPRAGRGGAPTLRQAATVGDTMHHEAAAARCTRRWQARLPVARFVQSRPASGNSAAFAKLNKAAQAAKIRRRWSARIAAWCQLLVARAPPGGYRRYLTRQSAMSAGWLIARSKKHRPLRDIKRRRPSAAAAACDGAEAGVPPESYAESGAAGDRETHRRKAGPSVHWKSRGAPRRDRRKAATD